jgi:MSHA biogenesis protein MshJ
MKQQLLQQWIKLSTRLDAMTLRERAMVFTAVVAGILFLIYTVSAEPLLKKQSALQLQIKQQQNQITGIDQEIVAKAQGFKVDPDAATREQLNAVRRDIDATSNSLMAVQKGLVAPDKIAPLLEHLLRGNGRLKLISLKTLPVTGLNEAAKPAAAQTPVPAPTPAGQPAPAKPRELLYRHGVEIVVQGSYLDMVNYMAALESLPVQLFWGKANLDAQQYPNSRLTLTLYTLSLDQKWMKL